LFRFAAVFSFARPRRAASKKRDSIPFSAVRRRRLQKKRDDPQSRRLAQRFAVLLILPKPSFPIDASSGGGRFLRRVVGIGLFRLASEREKDGAPNQAKDRRETQRSRPVGLSRRSFNALGGFNDRRGRFDDLDDLQQRGAINPTETRRRFNRRRKAKIAELAVGSAKLPAT